MHLGAGVVWSWSLELMVNEMEMCRGLKVTLVWKDTGWVFELHLSR